MVGVDFSIWSVVCFERGTFGKGGAGHFCWHYLPRVDGNRSSGRSADFVFCVQRARVVLENILPLHAYRIGGWAQKCGVKKKRQKFKDGWRQVLENIENKNILQ